MAKHYDGALRTRVRLAQATRRAAVDSKSIERLEELRDVLSRMRLACGHVVLGVTAPWPVIWKEAEGEAAPADAQNVERMSTLAYTIPQMERAPADPQYVERQLRKRLPDLLGKKALPLVKRFVRCLAHKPNQPGPMDASDAKAECALVAALLYRLAEAVGRAKDCIVGYDAADLQRAAGLDFDTGRWLGHDEQRRWGRLCSRSFEKVSSKIDSAQDHLMWDAARGRGSGDGPVPEVPACHDCKPWLPVEIGILGALHYQRATLDELAGLDQNGGPRVPKADGRAFSYEAIRKALLTKGRLRQSGIVDNKRGINYYRTDALPGQRPAEKKSQSGVTRV